MKAIAILRPGIAPRMLSPFRLPGVELTQAADLDSSHSANALLIFGGDGSVHRQLGALVESKVPLLVVPLGSGNDFARELGLRNYRGALDAWRGFCAGQISPRALDLGMIRSSNPENQTQRYFCNIAGFGLDAAANQRANAMPGWLRRHGGYVLAATQAMAAARPLRAQVEIRDQNGNWTEWQEGDATLVAIGNSPAYGGGMRIAPRARFDDGKLDVCFIRHINRVRLLRFFPRVFGGRHLQMPEVEYRQVSAVRVRTGAPTDIYADGEYAGRTPAEISVAPGALMALAPPG